MAFSINVVWGDRWNDGNPLTPALLNRIFESATFLLEGTLTQAQKPAGGIDSTWLGNSVFSGLTVKTVDVADLVPFHDQATGAPGVCTVQNLLNLGFGAISSVGSVLATDEVVVQVGGVNKRIVIREFAKPAAASFIADTAAGTAWSLTDSAVTLSGSTQQRGTIAEITSALISGQTELATSADVDLDADYALVLDSSASGTNKHRKTKLRNLVGATNPMRAWVVLNAGATTSNIGIEAVNVATDVITTSASHGLAVGDVVWTQTTVGDLAAWTPYYVKEVVSGTQVKLADTPGGAVKNLGSTFSGSQPLYKWTTAPIVAGSGIVGAIKIDTFNWRLHVYPAMEDTKFGVLANASGPGQIAWASEVDSVTTPRTTGLVMVGASDSSGEALTAGKVTVSILR